MGNRKLLGWCGKKRRSGSKCGGVGRGQIMVAEKIGNGGGASEGSVRVWSCVLGRLNRQPCGKRGGMGRNIGKPML